MLNDRPESKELRNVSCYKICAPSELSSSMDSPSSSEARLVELFVVSSDATESLFWDWDVMEFPERE